MPGQPKLAIAARKIGRSGGTCEGAFSLVELLVVVAIIAVLITLILPAVAHARRAGRTAVCRSNLKQLGIAGAAYMHDYKGMIPSFTWTPTYLPSEFPDLQSMNTSHAFHTAANARQATDIVRRYSRVEPNFQLIPSWIPSVDYTHLVMLEYLASRLPEPAVACPEDRALLLWQSDIVGFNNGVFGREQPSFNEILGPQFPNSSIGAVFRAKPYSSSYETVPAAYDSSPTYNTRISQSGAPNHYVYGIHEGSRIGGVRIDRVAFPSLKVHMHDTHQRHHGRVLYYAHPKASQPLLQFDGAVPDRRTIDSGKGWSPNFPNNLTLFMTVHYRPFQYEAPTSTGEAMEPLAARYRWTRGGLRGVDFGPEITNER